MNRSNIVLAVVAAGVIGAGGYGMYALGMGRGMRMSGGPGPVAASKDSAQSAPVPTGEKKVLYWHDPMVPAQKFDKPGKSPFMDMQLVPVYASGDGGDDSAVNISPGVQQNLGIRTAEVASGSLDAAVNAVGSVAYNDREVEVVQARSNGFVEKLYVRTVLETVKKGQALAQIFVPDWIAAQEEYLSVVRMTSAAGLGALRDGAKQRMRLVGMSDDQISAVATSGKVIQRFTLVAPASGIVSELAVKEGMTIMAGAPLFRINGIKTVWVNAEIPENMSAQVRPGMMVEARTPSISGAVFKGKVAAILPEINAATRTLKARIELANPSEALVPGMFASVIFSSAARQNVLLIPSEAVIQTGARSVVMVVAGKGKFNPVEVDIGSEAGGKTEIRKGLVVGQKVVVSGQFLIDSEASLRGTATRMEDSAPSVTPATTGKPQASQPAMPATPAMPLTHRGQGKIEKIDKDAITISHGPIPDLQWGPMTMGFKIPASGIPKTLAVGTSVDFSIRATADGEYEISTIAPVAASTKSDMKSMPMDGKAMRDMRSSASGAAQ